MYYSISGNEHFDKANSFKRATFGDNLTNNSNHRLEYREEQPVLEVYFGLHSVFCNDLLGITICCNCCNSNWVLGVKGDVVYLSLKDIII